MNRTDDCATENAIVTELKMFALRWAAFFAAYIRALILVVELGGQRRGAREWFNLAVSRIGRRKLKKRTAIFSLSFFNSKNRDLNTNKLNHRWRLGAPVAALPSWEPVGIRVFYDSGWRKENFKPVTAMWQT